MSIAADKVRKQITFSKTLLDKAEKQGIQKGKIEMLKELGFTIVEVCQKLGLTKTEVEKYFRAVKKA